MQNSWMTREESEEQPSRVEFDGRCVSLMSESMVVSEGIVASRSHFDSPPPTSAGKLGVPERAFSAAGAAFLSAILVNPLDVAKVLQGLETASNCVEDMDEWLGIFNVKLRHMREDIESIETHNNKLEMQFVNNKSLIEELDRLLERLCIPSEYAACLTGGSFDEAQMLQNIEACEWLTSALRGLEVPNLDPCYANNLARNCHFFTDLLVKTAGTNEETRSC